jgi:hypothetical protein
MTVSIDELYLPNVNVAPTDPSLRVDGQPAYIQKTLFHMKQGFLDLPIVGEQRIVLTVTKLYYFTLFII